MNHSQKPVKKLEDLIGKKTFCFPNELANERVGNDMEPCIILRINGCVHYILTGKRVELTAQEFAILKDAGIITDNYMYTENPEFDPLKPSYEITSH